MTFSIFKHAQDALAGLNVLPIPVRAVLQPFMLGYVIWKGHRIGKVVTNPHNYGSLITAGAIDWIAARFGADKLLDLVLKVECVLQWEDQARSFKAALTRLSKAISNSNPYPQSFEWVKDTNSSWISPSTKMWFRDAFQWRISQACKVAFQEVTTEFVQLCMRTIDVILVLHPQTAPATKLTIDYINNQGRFLILNRVQENSATVDNILGRLGFKNLKYKDVAGVANNIARPFVNVAGTINQAAGNAVDNAVSSFRLLVGF